MHIYIPHAASHNEDRYAVINTKAIKYFRKRLCFSKPLAEIPGFFLAYNNEVIEFFHGESNHQLYPLIGFVSLDKIDVENVLPVHTEEGSGIQFALKAVQAFIDQVFISLVIINI